jgi:hypothetical protein
MIGEKLGHYRVTAKIGEGGMGVVYRARDEELNREVAVKVLAAGMLERLGDAPGRRHGDFDPSSHQRRVGCYKVSCQRRAWRPRAGGPALAGFGVLTG